MVYDIIKSNSGFLLKNAEVEYSVSDDLIPILENILNQGIYLAEENIDFRIVEYSALVKTNSNWIYEGETLKINRRIRYDQGKVLYELSLLGTLFSERSYTIIPETDLIVNHVAIPYKYTEEEELWQKIISKLPEQTKSHYHLNHIISELTSTYKLQLK